MLEVWWDTFHLLISHMGDFMTLYDTNHNIHAINNAEINTSSYARRSKKKKKIGINVFTSQKLVNLFFLAVQYTEAGKHLLYIHHLLHKVNMCCTYFCILILSTHTLEWEEGQISSRWLVSITTVTYWLKPHFSHSVID